jgi:Cu(I)/Ag(I) efflux system membrane fusion protein
MSEHARANWIAALRWWFNVSLRPTLLLIVGILLIVALGLAQRLGWISVGGGAAPQYATESQVGGSRYVCPMICTPPLSEPGRCPVCAMELVPATSSGSSGGSRSIHIDPAKRRVANIRTAPVVFKVVSRRIRAVGRISYDEGRLKTLAAYVDGRIDRLYADYTGVVVNQGDELALLYSPELYAAQNELLTAKKAAEQTDESLYSGSLDSKDLWASARRKLIDLGMTEQQVAGIENSGTPLTRVELVAPIHGTVIDRLASEGEYVTTGQPIYRLADLSTVWLTLQLFPADAAAVRYGQRVESEVESLPGEIFAGRVAFVEPTVDLQTRTVGVRVVMKNEDGRLRIGDYATATIKAPVAAPGRPAEVIYDPELAGKWISPRHPHVIEDTPGHCRICGIDLVPAAQLGFTSDRVSLRKNHVLPRNAVLMADDHSVVYVESQAGHFELRQVTLGPTLGEEIVVLEGVKEGEQVATNGNFLIDSQMQLAGNPSLIDPTKAIAATRAENQDEKIKAALAELSPEDRRLAREQGICPVAEAPLGSMGPPEKVQVGSRSIFVCCIACRKALVDDPQKYFDVLEAYKQKRAATADPTPDVESSSDLPPMGPIQLLDDEVTDSKDVVPVPLTREPETTP